MPILTATFKDFSQRVPNEWREQERFPNVRVYYDKAQKCYCREVTDVKVDKVGDMLVPWPGQLISYPRAA